MIDFYERMTLFAKRMLSMFGRDVIITGKETGGYTDPHTGKYVEGTPAPTGTFKAVKLKLGDSNTNFNKAIIDGYRDQEVSRLLIDAVTAPFSVERGFSVTIGSDTYKIDQMAPHDPVGENIYYEAAIIK